MKIYTKSGDDGKTGLLGGNRVSKHHDLLDAIGALDELNAFLSCLESDEDGIYARTVSEIQSRLFDVGANIASRFNDPRFTVTNSLPSLTERLESEIDAMTAELPPLTNFILPGGTHDARYAHVCRAVCRRAERLLVSLTFQFPVPPELLSFINRLSDWLFTYARYSNHQAGVQESLWIKS
ncbi:cob(I)yrinic acid a,c-diamide adenosyltransferase [Kamptonema cortianum]|nr:cob(I)yrinic acid a,c-diamide adenosyltransferase [Geitlerinema splendidum]MDK3158531.1 cob(I)yrinic acid a,c-diamide adenosyltransferase [Kamptonema cortianum]